ncbi:hypothetical protein ACWGB8_33030 [Kitasatospora sp. NPDC054939]
MTGAFLSALGGRIAERWLALLAIPGLLYLLVLGTALTLGQQRWSDAGLLRTRLVEVAASPQAHSAGALALAALVLLAAAAAVGTAAQGLGAALERLWYAEPVGPLLRRLADRRLRRWRAADAVYRTALVAAGRARISGAPDAGELVERAERAHADRNRLGTLAPRHPFRTGDRLAAPGRRLRRAYRLDLAAAWPHLWLLAADGTRTELHTARLQLGAAARLCAWGGGYLLLGLWWWPAALGGAAAVLAGLWRARDAAQAFAELTEALAELHLRELAEALGVETPEGFDRAAGERLSRLLGKPD